MDKTRTGEWVRKATHPNVGSHRICLLRAVGRNIPPNLPSRLNGAVLSAFSEDSVVGITLTNDAKTDGFVLRGTVERAGTLLHISARIENSATAAILWSRVYDQPVAVAVRCRAG